MRLPKDRDRRIKRLVNDLMIPAVVPIVAAYGLSLDDVVMMTAVYAANIAGNAKRAAILRDVGERAVAMYEAAR